MKFRIAKFAEDIIIMLPYCYHHVIIYDSPKIVGSCFPEKAFRVLRGCSRRRIGCGMSLFGAFLFSGKSFSRFEGVQPATNRVRHVPFWGILVFRKKLLPKSGHKPAQKGPKLHNYLCACPFFGLSYFKNKCFTVFRTCNIMCIFGTYTRLQIDDMQYAHKKMKNILSPNLAKCYHFVIILLSSSGFIE